MDINLVAISSTIKTIYVARHGPRAPRPLYGASPRLQAL